MAILGLTQGEYNYFVEDLRESMALIGQDALLYPVASKVEDLYGDPNVKFEEPRKISLIFDDNPRPVLKKYNWFTEDKDLPFVAHVVALDNSEKPVEIQEHMVIRIPSIHGLVTDRWFTVTHVIGNAIDPWEWICTLVPYREKVDMEQETEKYDQVRSVPERQTSFGYLKI